MGSFLVQLDLNRIVMRAGSAAQAACCLCSPSHLEGEPSEGLGLPNSACAGSPCLCPPTGSMDRCRSCLDLVGDCPTCEQAGHEADAGHCSANGLAAACF